MQWSTSQVFVDLTNDRVGLGGLTSPSAVLDIRMGAAAAGTGGKHMAFADMSNAGIRHWIRTVHGTAVSASGNGIEFFINTGSTADDSACPGAGNVKVGGFYGSVSTCSGQ